MFSVSTFIRKRFSALDPSPQIEHADHLAAREQRFAMIDLVLGDMRADDVAAGVFDAMALAATQRPAPLGRKAVDRHGDAAPAGDGDEAIARVVVRVQRAGNVGQHLWYEHPDDLGQFVVGACGLHAMRHAAEQFDHVAAFAQRLRYSVRARR